MSVSTLQRAAALMRHESDTRFYWALAALLDTAQATGPANGGLMWDAAVNLARAYLGDES